MIPLPSTTETYSRSKDILSGKAAFAGDHEFLPENYTIPPKKIQAFFPAEHRKLPEP
jgi:hypothetical protein